MVRVGINTTATCASSENSMNSDELIKRYNLKPGMRLLDGQRDPEQRLTSEPSDLEVNEGLSADLAAIAGPREQPLELRLVVEVLRCQVHRVVARRGRVAGTGGGRSGGSQAVTAATVLPPTRLIEPVLPPTTTSQNSRRGDQLALATPAQRDTSLSRNWRMLLNIRKNIARHHSVPRKVFSISVPDVPVIAASPSPS